MDKPFHVLAEATGASLDQVRLITCLIVNYPLGSVYVRIPRSKPALRHLFSIVVSAIYLLPILDLWSGTFQLLAVSLITYILTATLHGKNMPWIVFAVAMGHLTYNHVQRALYGVPFETFEITGPQMVLTMKLTTFAWNVWDGRRPAEELDKWQLKHRVSTMPSLLEFLGYVFYFPGILVGPYTEYATYAALVDGSLFDSMAEGQVQGSKRKYVPEGRKRVAYTRMILGFISLGLFVSLGNNYSFQAVLHPSFLRKSPIARLLIFQFMGFVTRTRYYGVWLLTEGASILTGLGFTGYTPTGGSRWNGAANVNIHVIEFAPNWKLLLDAWNMNTNVWLRESVYKRVARKGKKPGFKSTMFTFLTSAFWHGIAAGYYLTFILAGFIQAAGKMCRANLRPLFLPVVPESSSPHHHNHQHRHHRPEETTRPTIAKRIYDFLGAVAATSCMNFCACSFIIGNRREALEAWSRVYYYGVVGTFGMFLFFLFGGKHLTRGLQAKRIRKAEKWQEETTKGIKVSSLKGKQEPDSYVVAPLDVVAAKVDKKLL